MIKYLWIELKVKTTNSISIAIRIFLILDRFVDIVTVFAFSPTNHLKNNI